MWSKKHRDSHSEKGKGKEKFSKRLYKKEQGTWPPVKCKVRQLVQKKSILNYEIIHILSKAKQMLHHYSAHTMIEKLTSYKK